MPKPMTAITAVEPVLMFRSSCHCGWWKVTGFDEDAAKTAVIVHALATRCDGCTDLLNHDSATVVDQGDRAGVFCAFCAPIYAA